MPYYTEELHDPRGWEIHLQKWIERNKLSKSKDASIEKKDKRKKTMTTTWDKASKSASRIEVFDFDDTIIQSAQKPKKGEPRYGWDGKDWWGSKESLQPPFLELRSSICHQKVITSFQNAACLNDTFTILLTGRRGVVANEVRQILRRLSLYGTRVIPPSNKKALKAFKKDLESGQDSHDFKFGMHRQYFSGDFITEDDYPKNNKGKPQHGTIYHKTYIVKKLMHENIKELVIWDDRDDHIRPFIALGLELRRKHENLETVTINRVFPIRENYGKKNCTVINIPVRPGMSY